MCLELIAGAALDVDRLGLRLDHEELAANQHLVGALDETVRRLAEIDARIAEHGGWPLA